MNLHSSTNRKPTVLSKGIRLAGFGAVVAASALMFSTESAHAGAAELKALVAALAKNGKTIANATPEDLKTAVTDALTANSKLKPGVVAGEALKTPASVANGAGSKIAEALLSRATDATSRAKLVGDAAKTATTGKGGTAQQVPSFSSALLQDANQAIAAAELARASKLGVGAILGGFAGTQPEASRSGIVTSALGNKKIAAAASDIARFVGSTFQAGATDEFALTIAQASPKLVSKIAPGVAAAAPTNAGEIVRKLLTQEGTTPSQDLLTNFQKGAAITVKAVAAVADIEQISLIGAYISDAIGNNVKGPNGKELVSLKSIVSLTSTLAKAIVAKPSGSGALDGANRSDEIAEVAATVVAGILGNSGLTEKTAGKLIVSIVKAAVTGGKTTKKQTPLETNYIQDIAGSVANTLKIAADTNVISTALRDAIKLALEKGAKSIGGKNAALVTTGLSDGFAGNAPTGATVPNPAYENGFDLANLVDPETDNKNF